MLALSWKAGLAGMVVLAATAYAFAEMPGHQGHGPAGHTMSPESDGAGADGCPMMQGRGMHGKHGKHGMHGMMHRQDTATSDQPSLPGQDAFGAIQEVVRLARGKPHREAMPRLVGPHHVLGARLIGRFGQRLAGPSQRKLHAILCETRPEIKGGHAAVEQEIGEFAERLVNRRGGVGLECP